MNRFDETILGHLARGDRFNFKNKFKHKDRSKRKVFQVEMKQFDLFILDQVTEVSVFEINQSKTVKSEMKKYKPDLEVVYLRSINEEV